MSAIIIFTVIRRRGFTRAEAIWAAVTLFVTLALSGAIELYQALFTSRVCAPRDVIANAAGALIGTGVVYVLTRRDTQQRQELNFAKVER